MRARVPQDVDLEDRLLFGLTATRFGELALAALAALAAWRLVPWVGGCLAALLMVAGAVLGWGRWRGRGVDHLAISIILFAVRNYRLDVELGWARGWRELLTRRQRRRADEAKRLAPARARPPLRVLDGPLE